MERFFGGPVLPTLIRLAIICVIVGFLLAIFGIQPVDLWNDVLATISQVWQLSANIADWGLGYLILGAIIVIPIWLLIRLWAMLTRK